MEPPEEIIVIKPREQKSVNADSSQNKVDEVKTCFKVTIIFEIISTLHFPTVKGRVE